MNLNDILTAFIIIQVPLNIYFLYNLEKLQMKNALLELDVKHNKRLFELHQKEIVKIKMKELGLIDK